MRVSSLVCSRYPDSKGHREIAIDIVQPMKRERQRFTHVLGQALFSRARLSPIQLKPPIFQSNRPIDHDPDREL